MYLALFWLIVDSDLSFDSPSPPPIFFRFSFDFFRFFKYVAVGLEHYTVGYELQVWNTSDCYRAQYVRTYRKEEYVLVQYAAGQGQGCSTVQ